MKTSNLTDLHDELHSLNQNLVLPLIFELSYTTNIEDTKKHYLIKVL